MLLSLYVPCVSVWMSGTVPSTTQTQTHVTLSVFSVCGLNIRGHKLNLQSSSESLHKLFTILFEKNIKIHTETQRFLKTTCQIKSLV